MYAVGVIEMIFICRMQPANGLKICRLQKMRSRSADGYESIHARNRLGESEDDSLSTHFENNMMAEISAPSICFTK